MRKIETLIVSLTIAVSVLFVFPGCSSNSVSGGTKGQLWAGGTSLCDIQVTIHRMENESVQSIGFGISGPDGCFSLLQNDAVGPLWLSPGEYRCTVESVGPVPLCFSKEFSQATTTPLKIQWESQDQQLDLELPNPVLCR